MDVRSAKLLLKKFLLKIKSDKSRLVIPFILIITLLFLLSLPRPLFRAYYSPVLYSSDGRLLGAMAAFDGQWRFPPESEVNEKFAAALVEAEDRRFYHHTGIDFPAVARAFVQNVRARRVVSGASTITMQTIRLSRPLSRRTVFEKVIEAVLAMRLELTHSKKEILALYAANAPFGANVVGLEAASWRWFGRESGDLSWAEAATLAVLPNGPGLIHPGRNRDALRRKRDALLDTLCARNLFDGETLALAKSEPLPGEPLPLPSLAPHYLARMVKDSGGLQNCNSFISHGGTEARRKKTSASSLVSVPRSQVPLSTLDYDIQQRSVAIMNRWAGRFAEQGIHNGACVVLDTATGELLAYIGNVAIAGIDAEANAASVDIASSPRSSGSLLKPFLYAALLDTGAILPSSLVSDIPTRVGSYHPENNSRAYLGVVPADAALARSLNVPAVRCLRLYGVDRFAQLLRSLGITTLWRRSEDYGLPLILGGAEVTLEEIAHLYAGLSSHYLSQRHKGHKGEEGGEKKVFISEGAAWLALEALTFVTRPGEDSHWQEYANSRRIAWKTGTSFGNRDAWAVGTRPDYTVGVWIGNATGEGRPGLVSTATSAPVLFEIFSALDSMKRGSVPWFPRPDEELFSVEVCALSGFPAGPDCASSKAQSVPKNAPLAKSCPYCRLVALNESGTARVALGEDASGYAARVVQKKWFVLPPAEEWYYRRWNLDYKPLPPFEGASDAGSVQSIALFNPEENGAVYVPRELEGREGRIVFQAATRNASGKIFWHLDDAFLGTTESFHEMEARPGPGLHIVTLVDENGATLRRWFTVLGEAD